MAFDVAKELEEQEKRESGVWFEIIPGVEIRLADTRSMEFQRDLQKQELIYRKRNAIRPAKELTTEQSMEVMWRALYGNVVKDWRGIKEKGKNLEFNKENFLRLMTDVWKFREAVMTHAADFDEIYTDSQEREELEKNSEAP